MKQKQFFQDQTNSAPLDIRNHECKDVRTCTGNVHGQTRVHINGRARTYTHTCIHHTPIHTYSRASSSYAHIHKRARRTHYTHAHACARTYLCFLRRCRMLSHKKKQIIKTHTVAPTTPITAALTRS